MRAPAVTTADYNNSFLMRLADSMRGQEISSVTGLPVGESAANGGNRETQPSQVGLPALMFISFIAMKVSKS